MRKMIPGLVLAFSMQFAWAQPAPPPPGPDKPLSEKMEQLKVYTRELAAARDFDGLLRSTASSLGLSGDNNDYLSFFYYYRGHAFHQRRQMDSAIANMQLSVAFSKKNSDLKRMAHAMQQLHYIYYYAGRGAERVPMMNEALRIIDTTTHAAARSTLTSMLSEYYYDQSQFEKAITFKLRFIEAEKLREQPPAPATLTNIGVVYLQVAETYHLLNQPAKALEYLAEAKPYLAGYYIGESTLFNNYIRSFLALDQPDSATIYYRNIYGLMKAGDSLYENLSYANRSFADYYIRVKKYPEALHFARKAYLLSEKSAEPISVYGSNQTLGTALYHLGQYDKALTHLAIAAKDSTAFGTEAYAASQYYMAQSYAALQNWEQAYRHYNIYSSLHDSIVNATDKKNINETEARFQNKEKQQQIENKNLQLKVAGKQRLWLLSGLASLLLVAILLVAFYRNKKRTADLLNDKNKVLATLNNELEEANQTKARLFGIISHDLRSPISQVYQFLKLQQLNPHSLTDQQKNELSSKIQLATGSLLETMEDLLLWSKTQMNAFKTDLQTIAVQPVIAACQQLLQLNSEAKNIRYVNQVPGELVVQTDPYYLQTIIRNLLQNAVKASPQNGTIILQAGKTTGGITIEIQNEGSPFTQEQYLALLASETQVNSLDGFGLRLTHELSQKIGARIRFSVPGDSGTRVSVILPSPELLSTI